MALVAIGDGAAEPLRSALPNAKGRCRLTILHSLAALGDAGAAEAFKQALKDDDREVRIAAGAGLAKLGDAGAVELLIKAAETEPGWERVQATKHCLVLAEKLTASGKKTEARRIYQHLRDTRQDASEAYIRQAAEKASGDRLTSRWPPGSRRCASLSQKVRYDTACRRASPSRWSERPSVPWHR